MRSPLRSPILIGATTMALAVQAWLVAIGVNPVRNGGAWDLFFDSDSYAHLLRALELARGGAWYDPDFHWANWPDGFAAHWTRLLDVLLAVPVMLAGGDRNALALWALALTPLLQVATLLVLSWATRPFLPGRGLLVLAALFATHQAISYVFFPGIVDHHPLLVLLFSSSVGLLLRAGDRPALAAGAGVLAAAGLWASAESLVLAGALGAALGLGWVLDGSEPTRARLARFVSGLLGGTVVALLIERPPGAWFEVAFDRISVVHLGASGAMLAVALVAPRLARGAASADVGRRLAASALAAVVAGAALLALLPAITHNPYEASAAVVRRRILPAIIAESRFLPRDAEWAYRCVQELLPSMLALGLGAFRLRRPGRLEPAERHRLLLLVPTLALLVAYSTYVYRGAVFAAVAGSILLAEGALRLASGAGTDGLRAPRLAAVTLLLGGNWLVALGLAAAFPALRAYDGTPPCRWDRLAPYLRAAPPGERAGAVLTETFSGPELAWRTGRPVIGAPYHGNAAGIEATYRMLEGPPGAALAETARRGVEVLTLCRTLPRDLADGLRANASSLGYLMLTDVTPPGFERVPLPPDVARDFVLYQRLR